MFKLNKWVWIGSCFFLLSGCAAHQQKNNLAMDTVQITEDQSAIHWYQLGQSYQKEENYSEAVNAYEKALALDSDNAEIYNAMGIVYSILDEHELATQLINEAIRYEPMSSLLHNNLGFAYLRWGHASEAAGAFHRALKLDPENSHARHNLATAYKEMGCADNEPCGQWQEPTQP